MHNRNIIYDEIAGLLIIYMVVYHIIQQMGLQNSIYMDTLSYMNFFMPWFFYKGGVCFHAQDIVTTIKKGFKRLLKPYIVWSFVGMIVFAYIACYIEDAHTLWGYVKKNVYFFLTEGAIPGNLPLWFLLALFVVRILLNICVNCGLSIIEPAILGIMVVTLLYFLNISLPYYFSYISSGLFFFGMGAVMRDVSQKTFFQLGCIVVYMCLSIVSKPIVDIRTNSLSEGYYLLWPIWSLAGIVTINTLFQYFHKTLKISVPFLSYIGKHSLIIYVIHGPILLLIYRVILPKSIC